jgi:RimJ/RimL family protein N-acetyltransferase
MGTCPTIETERLIMRPFGESDLAAYTAMLQTPEVRSWLLLPDDVGREYAWDSMARWQGQWALRNTGQWALEERATGALVGRAGSHWPEREEWPGIEIGWTLDPAHWGKGYASEAGAVAVRYSFETHPDQDALYSCIRLDNAASQAVAKRLGFREWEVRTFSWVPDVPHMVWRLQRAET